MISLTPRQSAAWERMLSDPWSIASKTRPSLKLGDRDLSHLLKSWEYSGQGGPAMVFEITIAGRFCPEELELEETLFELLVDGTPFRVFTGEMHRVAPDKPSRGYTQISASSAGYHLEGTEIPPALYTFNNASPSTALYEVLSLVQDHGGYAGIEIPLVTEPVFTRTGEEQFGIEGRASDIAEAIRADTGLTFYDDGENVARGYVEESLETFSAPVAELVAGRDFKLEEHTFESRFTERYSEVRVYRERGDGVEEVLATARVGLAKVRHRKPYDIRVEDADAVRAANLAYREALRLGSDLADAEVNVLYPLPYITRGDTVALTREDPGEKNGKPGRYKRRYLLRAENLSVNETKRMRLSGVQRVASEEFIADVVPVRPSAVDTAAHMYGFDYAGDPFFDTTLPWAFDVGDYVELDTAIAASYGVTITVGVDVVEVIG